MYPINGTPENKAWRDDTRQAFQIDAQPALLRGAQAVFQKCPLGQYPQPKDKISSHVGNIEHGTPYICLVHTPGIDPRDLDPGI